MTTEPEGLSKLREAASHLRKRELMPDALADYLAEAFECAVAIEPGAEGKPIDFERRSLLASKLGLTKPANRPQKAVHRGVIAMALIVKPGKAELYSTVMKLAASMNVAPNTIRSRMLQAEGRMAVGREMIAQAFCKSRL